MLIPDGAEALPAVLVPAHARHMHAPAVLLGLVAALRAGLDLEARLALAIAYHHRRRRSRHDGQGLVVAGL